MVSKSITLRDAAQFTRDVSCGEAGLGDPQAAEEADVEQCCVPK